MPTNYVKPSRPELAASIGIGYFGNTRAAKESCTHQRIVEILDKTMTWLRRALLGLRGTVWHHDLRSRGDHTSQSDSQMPSSLRSFRMDEIEARTPEQLDHLDDCQIRKALAFHACFPTGHDQDPAWYGRWVDLVPEIVADVLTLCALGPLRTGKGYVPGLYNLAHMNNHAQVAHHATLNLLKAFPLRCTLKQIEALDYLLFALCSLPINGLIELIEIRCRARV